MEKAGGMHEIKVQIRVVFLVVLLLGIHSSLASAASLRDRVLNDINISESEGQVIIRVGFNFPVRYLRHTPLEYGKDINIQVEPILAGVENAVGLSQRESLPAPENNPAGLVRVEYEGRDNLKPSIRVVLAEAAQFSVRQGEDFRSLEIVLPQQGGAVEPEYSSKAAEKTGGKETGRELTPKRQGELIEEGARAMEEQQYMRAVLIYTELLNSADPAIREDAQFKLAVAQDHKGHLAHARAEYKNYLTNYPEGEHTVQARTRLKALMNENFLQPGESAAVSEIPESGWVHDYFGGISVYYERDESLYDDEEDVENLSSLVTGFDARVRSHSDAFKAEAVAIGSYEWSFLDRRDDRVSVNRLYFDFGDMAEKFTSRVGRQTSSKGGVLTRFDGGLVGYRFLEKLRVNLVAGFPVNLSYDDLETDRYFYGINLDLGRFAGHWDVNTYFINQISDDVDDRRAVGGEVRFFSRNSSFYSLLDYDVLYDEVSVFLFNGNYLLPNDKTRINFMADFRGVPLLSTTNALIGQLSPSLESLEETIGEDELRRLAEDRTLDSRFATIGVTQVITANLQLAGDVSWSKIDGAPASGGVEAFESTGDEFFYSMQVISSGLFKQGDVSSAGLRYADTQFRDTYTLTVNTRYPLLDRFLLNPRLRIDYRENKEQPGDQWRFIPGLRMEYTLAKNWRFEIDGEYLYADDELPGIAEGKDGYAVSAGVRWDF